MTNTNAELKKELKNTIKSVAKTIEDAELREKLKDTIKSALKTIADKELEEELEDTIKFDLDNDELVWLWNDYCDENNYNDYRVYLTEELDELCFDMKPTDIIHTYGECDGYDYYTEDIGSGIHCSNEVIDLIEVDELVDYIVGNYETNRDCTVIDTALEEYREALEELENDEYEE